MKYLYSIVEKFESSRNVEWHAIFEGKLFYIPSVIFKGIPDCMRVTRLLKIQTLFLHG